MSRILYWGGAAAVAGIREEAVAPGPIGLIKTEISSRHGEQFRRLLSVSLLLLDGQHVESEDAVLAEGSLLEVLPPYAGG